MSKSRSFTGTLNNYTDDDFILFFCLPTDHVIVGCEVAPTTGTPHLQYVVHFPNAISFNTMKGWFPRARIDRVDNYFACMNYCKKTGDYYEQGQYTGNGKHKTKATADELLRKDCTLDEFKAAMPAYYLLHKRNIDSYFAENVKPAEHKKIYSIKKYDTYESTLLEKFDYDICYDISMYNGEKTLLVTEYDEPFGIIKWYNTGKYPYKYGYELKHATPANLVILYEGDANMKKLKKKIIGVKIKELI